MRQGKRVFWRFFMSYLLIMLIPFCLTIRIYSDEAERAQRDAYAKDTLLLEQGQRSMRTIISSMNDMMQTLTGSQVVKKFMALQNIYEDRKQLSDFISVRSSMSEFNLFSYVDTFFLYSYRSDTLINGSQMLYDAAAGNLRFLLPDDTNDSQVRQISSRLLTTRYKYEFLSPVTMKPLNSASASIYHTYVPYAYTITNSARRDAVNAILFVDANKLSGYLGFVSQNGWLYSSVQTKDGMVLLESGEKYDYNGELNEEMGCVQGSVNGQSALISYVTDSQTGLRFISVSSMAQIDALIAATRNKLLLMILLTGTIGLLLAGVIAMRTTAPLRRLLSGINSGTRSEGEPLVEYSDLDKELMRIMSENITLKNEISVQIPLLRSALLTRWLHGEYTSVDDIFEAYSRLGFELNFRAYAIVIVSIPSRRSNDTNNAERALVKALLRENLPDLIDIADVSMDAIAFVAGSEQRDRDGWRILIQQQLMAVRSVLMSNTSLEITLLAATAGDANRVHVSYVGLRRLYESDTGHNQGITWLTPETDESAGIFFPVELEMRIIDAIKNGDDTELNNTFARLYTENAIKRSPDDYAIARLAAVLDAMFIRLGCDGVPHIEPAADQSPVEALLSGAQKGLLRMCGQTRAEHVSRQQELRMAIEKYVQQNFADPQLSLSSVAESLNYTQAYVSRIFKQQTGELFSAYVERLRMERAQELLRQGDLPVYKVAEACGYNSVQVFRRAFAKVYGVSPSNFTESQVSD